jgi:type IV pilus assembly protein PilC
MNKRTERSKLESLGAKIPRISLSSQSFIRFSIKEQTFFAKRMSFLVKAGIPLIESLHLIRTQTKSPAKKRVFDAVIDDVSNGQYLSTSLGKFKRLFGDFTINLIRVGENSGILSQNLAYLADELQKKQALQRKVIGTLIYPVFITVATLGVTTLLTAYIFPKLMPIFTSLHVQLPLTTRALIWISAYLRNWGLLTLLGLIILAILIFLVRARFERVRVFGDHVLLSLPVVGRVARAYNLTNFCRTLGLLLRSGITLTSAIEITAETTPNRVYRAAAARVAAQVVRGEPLSKGLVEQPGLYPDIMGHMVSIGEKTGTLSPTLGYLGELYEEEVDELTKGLSNSIEPVLMIVMGLLVGIIAVSVIMPIYEITQHLSPK